MPRTSDKRGRLIEAAKSLIHRKGFHRTTLADIAKESGVPLGNVYYYFKTKEEICEAVIDERKREVSKMLDLCCKTPDPKRALKKFVQYVIRESDEIAECGCPNAGLCQELDKSQSQLATAADQCIVPLVAWAADQFKELGYSNAEEKGFEFNARIQGIMMLGHAMHDPKRIRRQLTVMCDWVDALEDRRELKKTA